MSPSGLDAPLASGPRRLARSAPGRFGTRVDRDEPVGFRFAGKALSGFQGDTLASALLANGVSVLGRSLDLGRPRGLMAIGLETAAQVALDVGPRSVIAAAERIAVREGMSARPVDSATRRLIAQLAAASRAERRTLPIPQRALERLRRHVPLPAPRAAIAEALDGARIETCDVAIIGAGLAGLAAASALRAAGLEVRVIEADARAGGVADLHDGTVDGLPLDAWAQRRADALRDRGALALGAVAVAVDPDGTVTALEAADPRRPDRRSLKLFAAKVVVLATGSRERPLVFPDNDRPGVMLSGAARALLRRHAVAPGGRVVVATASDDGYRTAADLRDAGVAVELVLDSRPDPQGPAVDMAKARGVALSFATMVAGVEFDAGAQRLTGVRVENRFGEGASVGARVIQADALVVSGGFAPRDELARRSGLGEEHGLFEARSGAGAADAVANGWAAGVAAASRLGAAVDAEAPRVEAPRDDADEPIAAYLARISPATASAAFVDIAADVTCADLSDAVRAGASGPTALARRLGLGLGPDGGRLSADLAAEAFAVVLGAEAAGRQPPLAPPSPGRATLGLLAARSGFRQG
jgi:NADPH-dependent 2,4-dienoyl-CoA reductase/sulfur reductase-like enzyme